MKIAVSSVGKTEDSKVSEVGARAPYYLVFEDKKLVKIIKNPFRIGGGGAGFAVAQMLADEGVDLIVSGRFGPNMKGSLDEKNIKTQEVKDKTVKEIIDEL